MSKAAERGPFRAATTVPGVMHFPDSVGVTGLRQHGSPSPI
jgi:hypothetical protein